MASKTEGRGVAEMAGVFTDVDDKLHIKALKDHLCGCGVWQNVLLCHQQVLTPGLMYSSSWIMHDEIVWAVGHLATPAWESKMASAPPYQGFSPYYYTLLFNMVRPKQVLHSWMIWKLGVGGGGGKGIDSNED